MTTGKCYRAFGRVLESEVTLGELHEIPAGHSVPDWRLVLAEGEPPVVDGATLVGTEEIAYGATVDLTLLRRSEYRLTYSDTGIFDVSAPRGEIRWWRPPHCDDDLAAMDILGRVLATMLHAEGTVTLHASAVAVDGVAIGFMAPKHHGKSTIAAAMTYLGSPLVSDDALAILPGAPVRCVPGVPSVRLRQESAAHFPRTKDVRAPDLPRWRVIDTLQSHQVALLPLPLGALYVLTPLTANETKTPTRRVPLGSIDAIVALTRFAKMGALLGDREGQFHVSRVVDIVSSVPVYSLEMVRDMQRLEEVSRTIASWHRQPGGGPGTSGLS